MKVGLFEDGCEDWIGSIKQGCLQRSMSFYIETN